MKTFSVDIPSQYIQDSASLGEILARKYSNGSPVPIFSNGDFARFIADYSGIIAGKRVASLDIALQIRQSALQVLWRNGVFGWIYRPIIIESGNIPLHNDDDSRDSDVLGNSIKRVNDAVTLIIPLYGFNGESDVFISGSEEIAIAGNGKQLIIHDQVEEHSLESKGTTQGERKLWWSGLIKRKLAEKKRFI